MMPTNGKVRGRKGRLVGRREVELQCNVRKDSEEIGVGRRHAGCVVKSCNCAERYWCCCGVCRRAGIVLNPSSDCHVLECEAS